MTEAARSLEHAEERHLRLLPAQRRSGALILSAAYVHPELAAEVGRLPPAFLPLGQRPLYTYQVQSLRSLGLPVTLTVPDDFELDPWDEHALAELEVSVVRVAPDLTLTQSLASVLDHLSLDGELAILHGDTLIHELPSGRDLFSTSPSRAFLSWSGYSVNANGRVVFRDRKASPSGDHAVVSGFFRFSDADSVRRVCAESEDFVEALSRYAATHDVAPAHTEGWLDFGHANMYYQSRAHALVARSFNHVAGTGHSVIKRSSKREKILAEARWFSELPGHLRPFVPHCWGVRDHGDGAQYETEYLFHSTLSELFVFGRLPSFVWEEILTGCQRWLDACRSVTPDERAAPDLAREFHQTLWIDKTHQRVHTYAQSQGLSPNASFVINGERTPGLAAMVDELLARIPATSARDLCLWHGDFCFSNTFYDFRSNRVRVVDPRGMWADGHLNMFGDMRYDLAKLSHSILGLYDHILAGRVSVGRPAPREYLLEFDLRDDLLRTQQHFCSMRFGAHSPSDPAIQSMTALLFFSMLPLHAEDPARQDALLANALRLYRKVVSS